jgi:hypothetical protein
MISPSRRFGKLVEKTAIYCSTAKCIPVASGGAVTRPSRRGGSAPRWLPQAQVEVRVEVQVGSAVIVPIITLSMLIAVFSAMVLALAKR